MATGTEDLGHDWTYASPPMLMNLGACTGHYRTGTDELIVDAETGKSWISFEDHAIALVDELEQPKHEYARFSIDT